MVAACCTCNSRCRCRVRRGRRRRQAQRTGRPRQRGAGLLALERTHVRRLGDVGARGVRREVAGEHRRERRHVLGRRDDLLGGGTALRVQARQPGREIEPWVPGAGEVPVDEQRPALAQAQVVAPDVHVHERVALDHGRVGGVGEGGQVRLDPAGIAESQREERIEVPGDLGPPRPVELTLRDGRDLWRRLRGGDMPQRAHHRLDMIAVPRRRPVGVAEVLEHEHGALPVVGPTQHLGGEGQTPVLGVEEVFVADPRRGVQGEGDLHERGRTVGQGRDPAGGRGLATPGHRAPRHRFHTERATSRAPGPRARAARS